MWLEHPVANSSLTLLGLGELCQHNFGHAVVSRIYAPRFATLALVESVKGGGRGEAYMRDLTYAPSSGATPRYWHRNILLHTVSEAGSTPICLCFSCPPETQRSRSTDRGWPQRRRWHLGLSFQCAIALTSLADTLAIVGEYLDVGFILALPLHHGAETLNLTV